MHITFIFENPIIPFRGGIERVTDILAKEFINKGHDVSFLSFKPIEEFEFSASQYSFPHRFPDNPQNKKFLLDFVCQKNVDVIIFQNSSFWECKFPFDMHNELNCLLINVIHNDPARGLDFFWHNRLRQSEPFIPHIIKFLPRLLIGWKRYKHQLSKAISEFQYSIENSDQTIILSSNFIPNIQKKLNLSYDVKKMSVIANPTPYDISYNEEDKENLILFVGRLTGNKQTDYIVRAWNMIAEKHPDWTLAIIGSGPQYEFIKSKIKFHKQTKLLGYCDPLEYYKKAKIFCIASSYEGWPMVLMEAMSQGVVPVSFNSFASVKDIIDNNNNGYTANSFKIKEYSRLIEQLIKDDSLRKRMAQSAAQKTRTFTPAEIGNEWIKLITNLSSQNGKHHNSGL